MQEAKVARTAQAFGQDVLQYQAQEFHAADGAVLDLFGLAVQRGLSAASRSLM